MAPSQALLNMNEPEFAAFQYQMWLLTQIVSFFHQFEPYPFRNLHQASGYSKVPAFVNFNGHASWSACDIHTTELTCMCV